MKFSRLAIITCLTGAAAFGLALTPAEATWSTTDSSRGGWGGSGGKGSSGWGSSSYGSSSHGGSSRGGSSHGSSSHGSSSHGSSSHGSSSHGGSSSTGGTPVPEPSNLLLLALGLGGLVAGRMAAPKKRNKKL